jgi:hypothetical protein
MPCCGSSKDTSPTSDNNPIDVEIPRALQTLCDLRQNLGTVVKANSRQMLDSLEAEIPEVRRNQRDFYIRTLRRYGGVSVDDGGGATGMWGGRMVQHIDDCELICWC